MNVLIVSFILLFPLLECTHLFPDSNTFSDDIPYENANSTYGQERYYPHKNVHIDSSFPLEHVEGFLCIIKNDDASWRDLCYKSHQLPLGNEPSANYLILVRVITKNLYILINDEPAGPFALEDLEKMVGTGEIPPETLYAEEGGLSMAATLRRDSRKRVAGDG